MVGGGGLFYFVFISRNVTLTVKTMFGVIFVPEDVKKREVRETNMGAQCQHTTA